MVSNPMRINRIALGHDMPQIFAKKSKTAHSASLLAGAEDEFVAILDTLAADAPTASIRIGAK